MPDEDVAAKPNSAPRKGGQFMKLGIIALLMVGEGAGVFFLTKAIGPSPSAARADGETGGNAENGESGYDEMVEVDLAECRPTNRMLGKLITYQIRVTVLVAKVDQERAEELVDANESRLRDRVNYVLRSADPAHLDEPGLQTIKRRIKFEIDKLFRDERLIKAVLIPQLLQSRGSV